MMSFKVIYPHLEQWLTYGGTLGLYSIGDSVVKVEVGDTDGVADEHSFECESIDDGMLLAEQKVKALIEDARELRDMYLSGDVKSPDQEIIHITGVEPIRNPFYETSSGLD